MRTCVLQSKEARTERKPECSQLLIFKMIPCTFVQLLLASVQMPSPSIWTLILEVPISGVAAPPEREVILVFSSETTPASATKGHHIYNPTKSSTAKLVPDATWKISYGDGSSAGGNVYTVLSHFEDLSNANLGHCHLGRSCDQ